MRVSIYFKRGRWSVLWLILAISLLLVPAASFAENTVSLKVGTVLSEPGEEIQIPVTIDHNSGLSSLKFKVKYDDQVLTLTNVTFPKRTGTYSSVPEPYTAEQTINFVSPLSSFSGTGTFATLSFSVKESAELNTLSEIEIEFDEDDIFDMDFNNVLLNASKGGVNLSNNSHENSAVLPPTMTTITEESFMNTSFSYIILPETTTTIESKAFADCRNLKYIYIPESTINIAENAFLNVTGLTIYGKAGSYAESYANRKGYDFQVQ